MNPSLESQLLTLKQVGWVLQISERTARKLVSDRVLPHVRIGRLVRVDRKDLIAYIIASTPVVKVQRHLRAEALPLTSEQFDQLIEKIDRVSGPQMKAA